jgi:hypothetical protein
VHGRIMRGGADEIGRAGLVIHRAETEFNDDIRMKSSSDSVSALGYRQL